MCARMYRHVRSRVQRRVGSESGAGAPVEYLAAVSRARGRALRSARRERRGQAKPRRAGSPSRGVSPLREMNPQDPHV